MATIKHIQTPDGVTHDIGGGGGSSTYTLTKSGNTITLTGSGGDVSSVTDANTTYSLSLSGDTLTLTPSSGSAQSVTIPDTDTTYTISISGSTITLTPSSGSAQTITIPDATTSSAGVMSASDKTKLDGIQSGAEANVQSDWNQSNSSADDYIKNKPSLATVATTGDYDDLTNKPSLATVATTGDYDDLTNKPTIPTVNDATLTIQKNGTTVETFTANSSTNKTANITVPTNTSDLNNDSGFTSVSVTQTLSSGTQIGSVTVDGTTTDLYAPSGGGTVTDVEVDGVSVVTGGVAEIDLTGKQDVIDCLSYDSGTDIYTNGLPDCTYMTADTLADWQDKLNAANTTGLIDKILQYMNNHSGVYYTGYGAAVEITSYNTSGNRYTVPSDGIIKLQSRYANGNYIGVTITNADGSNDYSFQIGSEGGSNKNGVVPVFKGQKVYISSNNGINNYVWFIPFLGVSVTGVEWSFGTRQEITLPYTAPTDGFLLESHRSSNSNNSYVQVGIGAYSYVAQANSGWAESAQFVVRAGESITLQATNNATGIKYIFMPIIAQAVGSGFNACYGSLTGMGSAMTLSTASQVLQYGTFDGIGCTMDSHGIKVDSGGVYQISGSTYFQSGYTQNDIIHLIINKRTGSTDNYVAQMTMRIPTGSAYCIYSVGPVIVQLAAGDIVQLMAFNQNAARGTVANYTGNGLYLHRIA